MIDIKSSEQLSLLLSTHKNVMIDLYADWCGPCKRISKPLEELEKVYKNVIFAKLNIDLMNDMSITSIDEPETIPCLLYFKNGQKIETLQSSNMQEIETGLKTYLDI